MSLSGKSVLISGGSGLIGRRLTQVLLDSGYVVSHLSRSQKNTDRVRTFIWNPEQGIIDPDAVCSADYVIHLAGENLAEGRWTPAQKQRLLDSRVESTRLLVKTIADCSTKPKVFVSASGAGYYGTQTTDKIYNESDAPAADFLGQICRHWEEASQPLEAMGVRRVLFRTGLVLTMQGGALPKLLSPVKWHLGAAFGDGSQFMPWIHIDDLCTLYELALRDERLRGPYNAVAPEFVTQKRFMTHLSHVAHTKYWLPNVPAFALKLALGEQANLLLKGSRIQPLRLTEHGFNFKFPNLLAALEREVRV